MDKKVKKNSDLEIASLYAQSIYDGAKSVGDLATVYKEMMLLREVLQQDSAEFKKLDNPLWPLEEKYKVIESIAKQFGLCHSMTNTLKLVIENRKAAVFPLIVEEFIKNYQDANNIAEVKVITAINLSEKQDKLLKEKLAQIFNKTIEVDYDINPQILGGLIIQYGTNFIDNSVKQKLNALEQLMKGAK